MSGSLNILLSAVVLGIAIGADVIVRHPVAPVACKPDPVAPKVRPAVRETFVLMTHLRCEFGFVRNCADWELECREACISGSTQ